MSHPRPAQLVRPLLAAALLLVACAAGAAAQTEGAVGTRQLQPADLAAWKSLRNPVVSNDGRWFAYQYAPNEGDAEVVLRTVADGKETRIPIGEAPRRRAASARPRRPLPCSSAATGGGWR